VYTIAVAHDTQIVSGNGIPSNGAVERIQELLPTIVICRKGGQLYLRPGHCLNGHRIWRVARGICYCLISTQYPRPVPASNQQVFEPTLREGC
jgi:hypothetical protein